MGDHEPRVQVSVICNAYNQEKYIAQALDGFVMQRTSFPFEVLVHDDASTDRTAEIIRAYAEKYPDLIKPVYQTENQYSRHVPISPTFQYPRAGGAYIALCEGDDCWTDPLKLQKQFDAMERHSEVDLCAHAHTKVDTATGQVLGHSVLFKEEKVIPAGDVIKGGGSFVATASLFFRRLLLENIPSFRQMMWLDYTMQVHGSLRGGMLYLPDEMCIYHISVQDSWTQRMRQNRKKKIAHLHRVYRMLRQMDLDTGGKYHREIRQRMLHTAAHIAMMQLGLNQK